MMNGVIKIAGFDAEEAMLEQAKAVKVEMWYDRHRREWVLYPVDAEGNQLESARYGFGKKEALEIKRDIEEACGIR